MRCLKFENQGNPVNQRKSHKVVQVLRSFFLLGTKINFASNNDEKIVDHIIRFHAITSRQRKWISASCRYQQNLEQNYLVIP